MEQQNMPKDLVDSRDEYTKARERQLALLEKGYDLGTGGIATWPGMSFMSANPRRVPNRRSLRTAEQAPTSRRDLSGAAYDALRSSFSAIHTLMTDWRVTPSRLASRSSDSIIQTGKSTLTRRAS